MHLNVKKWPSGGRMYAPKCVTPGVSVWSHWSSCVMCHASYIIPHVSCVMYHVSCVICVMCNLKFSFMCHLSCLICHLSCVICHVSCVISCHLKFRVIWHFVPFDILCHLTFCVIWHFVSFDTLCHLTFCVIWHFVPFEILCHLTFRVILFIIVKVIKAFMFKLLSRTGVFSKSGRIVIGQYHV